jgi:hypothetical protein
MMGMLSNQPQPQQEMRMPEQPSMLVNLRTRKERLEHELLQVNKALHALEKHPDVAEAIEAISRVAF